MRIYLAIFFLICFHFAYTQPISFLGSAKTGGTYGIGNLFSISSNGNNFHNAYSFQTECPGQNPQYTKLCEVDSNLFFGMTFTGGSYNSGTLFCYSQDSDVFTSFINFNGSNGQYPVGSLIKASNGLLYGMTRSGGIYNKGTIFSFDYINNILVTLHSFDSNNGSTPQGSLMQHSNGKLYATTYEGGLTNCGVIFSFETNSNTFTKLYDYNYTDGGFPVSAMIENANGKLYGTTSDGGTNSAGVLYSFEPSSNNFTVLQDLSSIGFISIQTLFEASDGNIYGSVLQGSTHGAGGLFSYNVPTNSISLVYAFDFFSGGGYSSTGDMIEVDSALVMMLAEGGGGSSGGVLFKLKLTTYIESYLHFFGTPHDGGTPRGGLIKGLNGKIYGLTTSGSFEGLDGTIFSYDPDNFAYNLLKYFNFQINGSTPFSELINASNGLVYGIAEKGGFDNQGCFFKYDPIANIYDTIGSISIFNLGINSDSEFGIDTSGILYCSTSMQAANGYGSFFKIDPVTSTITKLIDFPFSGYSIHNVMQATDGNYYGLSPELGGAISQFFPATNTFTPIGYLNNFNSTNLSGKLVEHTPNNLIGKTINGGINNSGVLFSFNTSTQQVTLLYQFISATDGQIPVAPLIKASDNKIYGLCKGGGNYSMGTLFSFDPATGIYSTLFHFDTLNGSFPERKLLQATDGVLYGTTPRGGLYGKGVLFSYDIISNTFTKLKDFYGTDGELPYSNLVQVSNSVEVNNTGEDHNHLLTVTRKNNHDYEINVDSKINADSKFSVTNLSGQVIKDYNFKIFIGENTFPITLDIAKGIYFLRVSFADYTVTNKFFVN
jgi:uncharacterized repeat protein (TIGR03803 family)